jgi:hypothetical protein
MQFCTVFIVLIEWGSMKNRLEQGVLALGLMVECEASDRSFPAISWNESIYPSIILTLLLYVVAVSPVFLFASEDDLIALDDQNSLHDADTEDDELHQLAYGNPMVFR